MIGLVGSRQMENDVDEFMYGVYNDRVHALKFVDDYDVECKGAGRPLLGKTSMAVMSFSWAESEYMVELPCRLFCFWKEASYGTWGYSL